MTYSLINANNIIDIFSAGRDNQIQQQTIECTWSPCTKAGYQDLYCQNICFLLQKIDKIYLMNVILTSFSWLQYIDWLLFHIIFRTTLLIWLSIKNSIFRSWNRNSFYHKVKYAINPKRVTNYGEYCLLYLILEIYWGMFKWVHFQFTF